MRIGTSKRMGLQIVLVLLIIVSAIIIGVDALGYGDVYETTDINDYLKIVGNFENNAPEAFVMSFFPNQIEDAFSQVRYHYKAKKWDGYAYECYLEFTIEDVDAYTDFIDRYVNRELCIPFVYDQQFQEQSISNILVLHKQDSNEAVYPIDVAHLGKILFSDKQQRIIFVAIGVHDGGGTNTLELNHFFSRFHIDPWIYYLNAYSSPLCEEKGITNIEEDKLAVKGMLYDVLKTEE